MLGREINVKELKEFFEGEILKRTKLGDLLMVLLSGLEEGCIGCNLESNFIEKQFGGVKELETVLAEASCIRFVVKFNEINNEQIVFTMLDSYKINSDGDAIINFNEMLFPLGSVFRGEV